MEERATLLVNASTEYVGRWNRLISTTNWEKGRIISEWREALVEADAPAASYTDEVWSQQVGNVTPQHVGRLRRAYDRFGQVHEQYSGLYWSHFQAALDWPDAEMYLQGAADSGWSVAQMRSQRWEALGGNPEQQPLDSDIVASEMDEEAGIYDDDPLPKTISETIGEVRDADDMDDDDSEAAPFDSDRPDASESVASAADAPPVRPFEALPPLPADLNNAFDLMRLAILNHKVSGWQEIARDDLLAVLESLKQLALAPAE
jgi:hypothetical protein